MVQLSKQTEPTTPTEEITSDTVLADIAGDLMATLPNVDKLVTLVNERVRVARQLRMLATPTRWMEQANLELSKVVEEAWKKYAPSIVRP